MTYVPPPMGRATALLLCAAASSACHGADQPTAPTDAQAFVAAAPVLSLHEAVGSLALSDEDAAALRPLTDALEKGMMATHRRMQDLKGLEGEALSAAHEVLRAEMKDLTERHDDVTERLTPEQREAFMDHVRRQMDENEGADGDGHRIHGVAHEGPGGG